MGVIEKVMTWMLMWSMHHRSAKAETSSISAQASIAIGSYPTVVEVNRRVLMVDKIPKQALEVALFWVPILYTSTYSETPTPFVAVRMFETD
jgi:hypothetical protein